MKVSIFLLAILSGFVGTVAMTIVMYVYAYTTQSYTKVVHVLGIMLTGRHELANDQKKKILTMGCIAHLLVGVSFSFSYFLLWNWGMFDITLVDSIVVGALSGILAIIGWKFYFIMHDKPPKISLLHYFIALFISHVVFGIVTFLFFNLIIYEPQFWFQLQKEINLSLITFL